MFCSPPGDLQLGSRQPEGDGIRKGVRRAAGGDGFVRDDRDFPSGCCMYLASHVFEPLAGASEEKEVASYAAKGRFHKGGSNSGLRPWGVCQLLEVLEPKAGAAAKAKKKAAGRGGKKAAAATAESSGDEDEASDGEAAPAGRAPTHVRVRRFYRPEEVSQDAAYKSSYWDLYYSSTTATVPIADVVGRCTVAAPGAETGASAFVGRRAGEAAACRL